MKKPKKLTRLEEELLALVDGAYTIVELYSPDKQKEPYNVRWRALWLEKARELGASPD